MEEGASAADALTVALTGAGLLVAGASWLLLLGAPKEVLKTNVNAEDLTYLCEGEHSVLCAYTGNANEWRGRLLQLPKDGAAGAAAAKAAVLRAKVQRALSSHCFETRFIDEPQVVVLPSATVRAIEAHILSARPQEQRQARLGLQEHADYPGNVLALRLTNLMEAPPPRAKGTGTSPLVVVELPLGCGLREVADLPSRHALAWHLAQEQPVGVPRFEPTELFMGSAEQLREALRATLEPPAHGGSCRVFVDGQPVHPTALPGAEGRSAAGGAPSGGALAGGLPGCSPSTATELGAALSAVLGASQRGHGFLIDLQRLQCYAAGECEKMAVRLLEDLQAHGGEEAVTELGTGELIMATIARASHGWTGKDGVRAHEREGRRLIANSSWGPQEVAARQQWLALFLLGRAALGSRAILSFFSPCSGAQVDPAEQRRLRALRFAPLTDFLPNQAWCADVWVSVTVVGLEPRPPSEIAQCKSELEDLVRHYRDLLAAAK